MSIMVLVGVFRQTPTVYLAQAMWKGKVFNQYCTNFLPCPIFTARDNKPNARIVSDHEFKARIVIQSSSGEISNKIDSLSRSGVRKLKVLTSHLIRRRYARVYDQGAEAVVCTNGAVVIISTINS